MLLPVDEKTCDVMGDDATFDACLMRLYQRWRLVKKRNHYLMDQAKVLKSDKAIYHAEVMALKSSRVEISNISEDLNAQLDECKCEVAGVQASKADLSSFKEKTE